MWSAPVCLLCLILLNCLGGKAVKRSPFRQTSAVRMPFSHFLWNATLPKCKHLFSLLMLPMSAATWFRLHPVISLSWKGLRPQWVAYWNALLFYRQPGWSSVGSKYCTVPGLSDCGACVMMNYHFNIQKSRSLFQWHLPIKPIVTTLSQHTHTQSLSPPRPQPGLCLDPWCVWGWVAVNIAEVWATRCYCYVWSLIEPLRKLQLWSAQTGGKRAP